MYVPLDNCSPQSSVLSPQSSVGQPSDGPNLTKFSFDLVPRVASILAAINLSEQAQGQDSVAICRMGGEAPNRRIGLHGEVEDLPCRAEICRA